MLTAVLILICDYAYGQLRHLCVKLGGVSR
jgi:hypothetical protein